MMVFIIVNIFISILSDMYIRVKVDEAKKKSTFPLFILLKAIRNMVDKIEDKRSAMINKLHRADSATEGEEEGEGGEEGRGEGEEGMFGLDGDEAKLLAESIRSLSGDHDGIRYSVISQLNSDAQLQQVLRSVDVYLKREEGALKGTAEKEGGSRSNKEEEEEERDRDEHSVKKGRTGVVEPFNASRGESEEGEVREGEGKEEEEVEGAVSSLLADNESKSGSEVALLEVEKSMEEVEEIKEAAVLSPPPSPLFDATLTTSSPPPPDRIEGGSSSMHAKVTPSPSPSPSPSPFPPSSASLLVEVGSVVTEDMLAKISRMEEEMQKLRAGLEVIVGVEGQ